MPSRNTIGNIYLTAGALIAMSGAMMIPLNTAWTPTKTGNLGRIYQINQELRDYSYTTEKSDHTALYFQNLIAEKEQLKALPTTSNEIKLNQDTKRNRRITGAGITLLGLIGMAGAAKKKGIF